jgi:hypothetical protein
MVPGLFVSSLEYAMRRLSVPSIRLDLRVIATGTVNLERPRKGSYVIFLGLTLYGAAIPELAY